MTPVGSSGDVHPYIGIGRALRRRGHDVTIITSAPFQTVVERAGLMFIPTASVDEYDQLARNPDLWHPRRGLSLVLQAGVILLRRLYVRIEQAYEPGRTVLVGHTLAFSTRVFEEVHGVPAVTVHLSPSAFRSDDLQPALMPGLDLSWLPVWQKRALWWALDRWLIDPHIAPELNRWRGELGLPPVSRVFREWMHSPRAILGLFPPWFGPPQPDWPAALRLTGFPGYDEAEQHSLAPDLERFLGEGDPPIVFTPGSANPQAHKFFEAAGGAAVRLGRRALLLTRYAEQVPSPLPEGVRHEPYVPLSAILPRSAALVHHGGIGTCAQGLAAGVPQLTMPIGFDQPDNVTRLHRLGVGRWIAPRRFTGRHVARALAELLRDEKVAAACRHWAAEMARARPVEETCEAIEAAGGNR